MFFEETIGDGDHGGAAGSIEQAIGSSREVAVIDPYITRLPDMDAVALGLPAFDHFRRGNPNQRRSRGANVVDMNPMEDDVVGPLNGDLRAPHDVHLRAAAIDGLEGRDPELAFEFDGHAPGEGDPERPAPRHAVAKSPPLWILRVVAVVGDDVDRPVLPPDGVAPEPWGAGG